MSRGEIDMRNSIWSVLFIFISVFSTGCGEDLNIPDDPGNNPNPVTQIPSDEEVGTTLPPPWKPPPYVFTQNPFTEDGLKPVDYCQPNLGGDWGWWCLIRGPYESHNNSKMHFTIYRVRTDICPSGMAVGELFPDYFTPPTACLNDPESPEVSRDSGAVHMTGRFHFCHCNLLADQRGDRARQKCYGFQNENGDREDENTCDGATGGTYLVLTDGLSTFRYDRLDPRGGP